ncbi:MAG: MBL fold metallo-hydrolase [Candidatus Schekmanbacteria bacterium]|nr:MBL fold metallo-hydrolase [Candidatus Schekmanbacteria bacterium]
MFHTAAAVTIDTLVEAHFRLDGGAMFGIIPKPLWQRGNPADELNRIDMSARCLVIRHPTAGIILVDTGMGDKWDAKSREIYRLRPGSAEAPASSTGMDAGLRSLGLTTADVNHVILTHLHFDHAGGLTRRHPVDGDPLANVPAFPRACHHVLRENWSWANRPSERDAGSYRDENFRFLAAGGAAPELVLHDGLTELFPGVSLIPRCGHTPGMACVLVRSEADTYLFLADLIPTLGHLRIPYVMGYDLNPVKTCQEKRELLSEAARSGWRLVFAHDPVVESIRVEPDGRGEWRRACP